jgi:hypothetical protein
MVLKKQFTYYSITMMEVEVDVGRKRTSRAREVYDFDICDGCYGSHLTAAKEVAEKTHDKPNHILCMRCAKHQTGAFKYYIYRASRVDVDVAGGSDPAVEFEIDMPWCEECMNETKERCNANRARKGDWS